MERLALSFTLDGVDSRTFLGAGRLPAMPRRRRQIESKSCYEITFRARRGLPFPAWLTMNLLLKSAIARAQRDAKVTISHQLWMTNHPHFLIVAKDAKGAEYFHAEVKKKITDSMKRLLDFEQLSLWEEHGSVVAKILDLEAAKKKIAYQYNNPARAALTPRIEEFPGLNSFEVFKEHTDQLDATHSETVPWVQQRTITAIPGRLSTGQDANYAEKLKARAVIHHDLVTEPNTWMKCFGVTTDEEAAQINADILLMIREGEARHQETRRRENKGFIGAQALRQQPITWEHVSKKEGRPRIFVITTIDALRVAHIKFMNHLERVCRKLYESARAGARDLIWPPGVNRPPLPPQANAIALP